MQTFNLKAGEKREWQDWLDLCERLNKQTDNLPPESGKQKAERIERLKNDFQAFCQYYFGGYEDGYMSAPFGWFHLKAAKIITEDKNAFACLEWPREHAKSVFAAVFLPLFLKARGELTGMVVASANDDKACGLLSDIQAQLSSNQRYINDFGIQVSLGDWRDGKFSTTDGIGFWAFGRGQSPRGIRKAAKRPNYALIDDIDDKTIVKNPARVAEAIDWVIEDLFGALGIKQARLIMAGNRIHKNSILANFVGDVEDGDPKREGLIHIKVFATENKQHGKAYIDEPNAKPAWKENYTLDHLKIKFQKMGGIQSRSVLREYYHEHAEQGLVFKPEWLQWGKVPKTFDRIVIYCDPSFKDTKTSDFKAIVAVGKKAERLYILRAWVRKASVLSMVKTFYDWHDGEFGGKATYHIESNMLQDMLHDSFTTEAKERGYAIPYQADRRKKENKESRIENLSPLFERGYIIFNEDLRSDVDIATLRQQLLAFGDGREHDDAPDALEGAVYLLQKMSRTSAFKPRIGNWKSDDSRKG